MAEAELPKIDRPPRIQPALPAGTVEIPKPPEREEGWRSRLIQIGLPLATVMGYVLVSALGGSGRNPWLIIPMALSVLASTGFAFYSFIGERRRQAARERGYADQLTRLADAMRRDHEQQRRFYTYNYPDPGAALRIVLQAAQPPPRPGAERRVARLWERRAEDSDFGVVRLGVGTLPSTVIYALPEIDEADSPLARAARKLADDSRYVAEVPLLIGLRPPPPDAPAPGPDDPPPLPIPATHALAIAGPAAATYPLARALTAHFVTFHAHTDARLYVLAPASAEWDWTRALPHCQPGDHGRCLHLPSDATTLDEDLDGSALDRYLEGLRRMLAQRKVRLQEREGELGDDDPTRPFCLVIVDLHEVGPGDATMANLESEPAIAILLAEGAALGATVIVLVPERTRTPSGCQAIIEVEEAGAAAGSLSDRRSVVQLRYAETGRNTHRFVGEADLVVDERRDEFRRTLAALQSLDVRRGLGAGLPTLVPFLDLHGANKLEDLRKQAEQQWQESARSGKPIGWLRARLGMVAGNKPRTVTFSSRRDGVHALIAGSTGTGKSELLISLISSLAVSYDPSVLNFVLVDYKGGSALKKFEQLPHVVNFITNLHGAGVGRMFTAVSAELQRRQELLVRANAADILEYRRRGHHADAVFGPLPFLVIVIDEFAEMIGNRSDFRDQLESIASLGRSLGVSLVLASQRPAGLSDQMRANLQMRICLRVEGQTESRELLQRSDAAFLPAGVQGRGYLRVGHQEIELIQIAYTGGIYRDPSHAPAEPVKWPKRPGYTPGQSQEPPRLYEALVAELRKLADEQGRPRQMAPWPDFLPAQITLAQPLTSRDPERKPAITAERYLQRTDLLLLGRPAEETLTLNPSVNQWLGGECGWIEALSWEQHALRPVAGLVDDPQHARQLPLALDLRRGHACVFGASGWGKSTLIRTLLLSLAASHSPSHLHLYALDLGGRALAALAALPHTGAVITPEEGYEELVGQLIRELEELVEARKKHFGSAVDDLYAYNHLHADAPLPAVVLAIDNFLEFAATFGRQRDDTESLLDRLVTLARQSRAYGVHMLIAASQVADLSSQLLNLFTERLALNLSDPGDYRAILGANVAPLDEIPGRGYVRVDGRPLLFQAALPVTPHTDAEGKPIDEIQELIQPMVQHVERAREAGQPYRLPTKIEKIPAGVYLRDLLRLRHNLGAAPAFWPALEAQVLADWRASLEPAHTDWLKATIGAIAGNQPRELQLEAKRDGVHALIAGGTGAGKSELLTSLILSLALRYDPSVLNFVLVDYKGGGAFAPFKDRLPHVVDVITNLNKAAVQRVFSAIRAELNRRMKLSADSGGVDIVEYRKRDLHRGPNGKPYPHLVIIIDEFAELITDNPEFSAELDSITRVGRSIGVNLILASQRPIGVTDQMRANIKLRICLRVEGPEVSRELLRRSDAAFLPNNMPGRGYLQVGNDGIALIQAAYAGEPAPDVPPQESGEARRFFEAAIDLAGRLVPPERRPSAPWPPMLPPALTFAHALRPRYLPEAQQGRSDLRLLPAAGDWLDGRGRWAPVAWDQATLPAVVGLLDDPARARQAPLILDLMQGHGAIYGAPGWGKSTLLRALALGLAAAYSPEHVQIHALDLGGRALETLGHLPHVGTIITPERGYEERVRELWRRLSAEIDQRKAAFAKVSVTTLAEYNSRGGPIFPALVVLIDNIPEFFETFGGATQLDDPNSPVAVLLGLVRQGRAFGLHVLITANRPGQMSGKIASLFTERLALRLADAEDYSMVVGGGLREIEAIPGRGAIRGPQGPLLFQVAVAPGALDEGRVRGEGQILHDLGKLMRERPIQARPLRIGALQDSFSYRDWQGECLELAHDNPAFLDRLKEQMRASWAASREPKTTDWLTVVLGLRSGNTPRRLRLKASDDGVHGLIAGGTGSGKSELLMTLIVGLAMEHAPEVLNFLLVDFKGGGAFQPFRRLPHVVDVVTNLNKAGVHRVFTALDAELRRRQGLNAQTGTKDIVEYRRKGLHQTLAPFPHLVVIIDEYAEMIDQNREFLPQLESITRVGRSIGVNLILASQRPRGVTDQMRANIKLRLCLRVEEHETSRELLRRPDAALLPGNVPGRGYLQIGNDEIELIQVGFTGEEQIDRRDPPVRWPGRAVADAGDPPRFYDAVVALAGELNGGAMAPRRWPDDLPQLLSLAAPLPGGDRPSAVAAWLADGAEAGWRPNDWRQATPTAAIGLVDHPADSRQFPLELAPARGHIVVFGDSGSGKSTLLRTLAVGLAAAYSPGDAQWYGVDLGGRALRTLEQLPHTGAVIYADDDSFDAQLQRLFDVLGDLADTRQQLIGDSGAAGFLDFNARHPDRVLPLVLVLIDNFADLRARYEAFIDNTLLPLARRALGVGLSFVVATNIPSALPDRLYNLFSQRLTLRQTDHERYLDIVGRGAVELGEIAGRGYLRYDRRPLPFQVALPTGVFDRDGRPLRAESDDLAEIGAAMAARLGPAGPRPLPIAILRNRVPLAEVLDEAPAPIGGQTLAALGRNERLEPVLIDLAEVGPHLLITGPPQSGKTTALRTLALALAMRHPPRHARLVLIDVMQGRLFGYGGQRRLSDLPHVLEAVDDPARLPGLISRLGEACAELAQHKRPLFLLIDGLEDLAAELDSRQMAELAGLFRRYGSDGLHVIATSAADATPNDLRRRVLAGGFGLGLRSAQAVEVLRVMRTPPALRDRELPRGRGYLVRSGQPQLVQVAEPLGADAPAPAGRLAQAAALDAWVERVISRHGDSPRAAWPQAAPAAPARPIAAEERLTAQMADLVQALARRELGKLRQGKPANSALIDLLLDGAIWADRERLRAPLADEVRKIYELIDDRVAASINASDEQIINTLWPKLLPDGAGTNGKERP